MLSLVIGIVCAAVAAVAIYSLMSVRLSAERRIAEEKERSLAAAMETMLARVSTLTAEKLASSETALAARNAQQVKPLFDALKDRLEDFRRAAESSQKENAAIGAGLKAKLDEVGQNAKSLGTQASDFVNALKGGNKVQGNWGEGLLSQTLANSGLVRDVNFFEQTGTREDRPDVTVVDGDGHKILIDAKVNITDFSAAMNAANEGRAEEASALLKKHAASVRTQIAGLAAKKYPEKFGAEDLVIMFMPSEATYAAAVQADPEIISFANAQKVALATPQMLLSFLLLFHIGIARQQRVKNQEEIGTRVRQLLDRLDAAFVSLEKVGKAIDEANVRYHEALAKLGYEPGAQNIATPAKEIVRLAGVSDARRSAVLQA